jgi:hypothetical protein
MKQKVVQMEIKLGKNILLIESRNSTQMILQKFTVQPFLPNGGRFFVVLEC